MAWDDAKRNKAVELYEAQEPTPTNSVEIVAQIAEELDETVNSVRMLLIQKGVYIKKEAKAGTAAGSSGSKTPRVSKEDSQNSLKDAIEAKGLEADMDIISKLTGKAAVYFTGILS